MGVDPSAAADTIKNAFRHEIARYHPDKVVHLGQEFQEMAARRAAELTVAYKVLIDAAQRAEYDARLTDSSMEPPPPMPTGRGRFETERAGRDVILRRAVEVRIQGIVEGLYGKVQTPTVRGFDLALVPVARPRLIGAPPPRVLIKSLDTIEAASVNEAWSNAARARVHLGKSPVVALLVGTHLASPAEIHRMVETLSRQPGVANGPAEIAIVVVDTADFAARLPPGASPAVQKLVAALRA